MCYFSIPAAGKESLTDAILGRPLANSEDREERLGILTGVPVLGLDALASTAYGPEAALTVLLPLGLYGLRWFPYVILAVLVQLGALYISYQQTAAAYPNGGGAYIVAKDNLGMRPALWAAVALMLDYLLNVAVGIAAGVGAAISAVPALHSSRLLLCLGVLLTLTFLNLRGIRESGLAFIGPVFLFIGCIGIAIIIGITHAWQAAGAPHPVIAPPAVPQPAEGVRIWLLLSAFANACTAMTGVEAVSNGVPLFREPTVPHAQRTLTIIVGILAVFLLGVGYLCPAYRITAMNEQQPGYQTILSQLITAVAGRGIFYYAATGSIFVVLAYSAQTSFTDFPRVCRLLAEDDFLPTAFANRGRRLVFSHGIVVLAFFSAIILIAFDGVTQKLIPLFAVGAFSAFLFSQVGMTMHWLRRPGPGVYRKLLCNGFGAAITAVSLAVMISAKFTEGAWITVVVVPTLVVLLGRIKRHHETIARELDRPLDLVPGKVRPLVIIPISGCNRMAEKALRFGLQISDEVVAVHVACEPDDKARLQEQWKQQVEMPARAVRLPTPSLVILDSPYRRLYKPFLDFVKSAEQKNPDRTVAVVIPEIVEPHWYEYLLHNLHGTRLKASLYRIGNEQTVVVSAPWHLHTRRS